DVAANPQTQANLYLNSLAKKMSGKSICCDMFVMSEKYSDIVTIGEISRYTGGELYYYPKFQGMESLKLQKDMMNCFDSDCGFDVEVRLRTSTGVFIEEYLGNLLPSTEMVDTVRIGYMKSDQSVIGIMDYDEEINKFVGFFLQAVVLYTDIMGKKRMKIFNGFYSTVSEANDIFKKADLDVIFTTILRQTIKGGNFRNNESLNLEVLEKVTNILAAYRKYCSVHAKSSILLLPEALKLLPIFVLGAMKTPAFMAFGQMNSIARDFAFDGAASDLKFASIYQASGKNTKTLLKEYYPTCYNVTGHLNGNVSEDAFSDDSHKVRLAINNFKEDEVYLFESNGVFKLFVGYSVSEEIKAKLFGEGVKMEQNTQLTTMLYSNALADNNNLMTKLIYWISGMSFVPMVLVDVVPFRLIDLPKYMVEDKTFMGVSYFDLLVYCHKKIQQKLN
ncbi:protein transport protein Sec24, putative, partial [Entamoeba invadens IP1]